MREITDTDVTVNWESGYDQSHSDFFKQEYVVKLSEFQEDDSLKEIATSQVHAPKQEYAFDSKLEAMKRYQVEIVTLIQRMSPATSTPVKRGLRADSGKRFVHQNSPEEGDNHYENVNHNSLPHVLVMK